MEEKLKSMLKETDLNDELEIMISDDEGDTPDDGECTQHEPCLVR